MCKTLKYCRTKAEIFILSLSFQVIISDVSAVLVVVTTSSPTSAKPQISPSEKTTTSVMPLKSSEEEEDDEEGASDEHGEFNNANFLFVSQHLHIPS